MKKSFAKLSPEKENIETLTPFRQPL